VATIALIQVDTLALQTGGHYSIIYRWPF